MKDEAIVEKIYLRDESGLLNIKEKYDGLLYGLSYRILNNLEDAKECVNDTYIKTWDTIPPYKPSYLKSFLCKIDRQISIDKYRKNKNKNCLSIEELDYEIKSNSSIEKELLEKDLVKRINDFIENLNFESKTIFIRKYFLLESSENISKITGLSINSINVKVFRIRKKLLKYLENEGYYYGKS